MQTTPQKEFITSEDEHWYPSPTVEDKYYPSVTTILGEAFPKGIQFQKYLAAQPSWEESREVMKTAGRRGTRVHEATEILERGETLNREAYTIEEWQMLMGFVNWHREYNPKAIYIEYGITSDLYETGGTIDRVYNINGLTVLVDIKTSSAIHDNYWLQVAAYVRLLEEKHPELVVAEVGILRLATSKKKGNYEFKTARRHEINTYATVFGQVYGIWKYLNPNKQPKLLELPTSLTLKSDDPTPICELCNDIKVDVNNAPCVCTIVKVKKLRITKKKTKSNE